MSEIKRYRTKPVEVEAMRFDPCRNCREINQFVDGGYDFDDDPCDPEQPCTSYYWDLPGEDDWCRILPGQWVVKRKDANGTSFEIFDDLEDPKFRARYEEVGP